MAAEFECAVCHWAIFDPIMPPVGAIDRTCHICTELARMYPPEFQAAARQQIDHPIMPDGYGRNILRQRESERA